MAIGPCIDSDTPRLILIRINFRPIHDRMAVDDNFAVVAPRIQERLSNPDQVIL